MLHTILAILLSSCQFAYSIFALNNHETNNSHRLFRHAARRRFAAGMSNTSAILPPPVSPQLLGDIRSLIAQSRMQLAAAVNSALTLLYWHIGQRIRTEVLNEARAAYGDQIVSTLSRQLETEHGRGFSIARLCLRSAETIELDAHQDGYLYRRHSSFCQGLATLPMRRAP